MRLDKGSFSHLSRLKSDILIREISVHVAVDVDRKSLAITHPRGRLPAMAKLFCMIQMVL